MELRLSNFSI